MKKWAIETKTSHSWSLSPSVVFLKKIVKNKEKWKCKILSKSESESLTFNLSLATDDVIEGALGGHQGEQAGGGHQQEEDRAHDGAG